jgi:iron complex outermembrane recepter protein
MKKFSILSLAAIAALASEPVAIQKITVTEDTPTAEVTQDSIAASAAKNMTGDSASRLTDAPGVSLYTGGGISSLPVIHGMADDRVKIDVDGMTITSACPNHMNPALSYTDTSKIAEMNVIAGITPVSQGGDSIGGTIVVKSKDPIFANKSGEVVTGGDITGFYHSNNDARGAALNANAANDKISVSYSGYTEKANNYKNGNGITVKGTLYEQQNHSATIAYKLDEGVVAFELGTQNVDDEGFVNQYMDMLDNRSTHGNLSYKGKLGNIMIDANAFLRDTDHYMNKIRTERNGNMPMYTEAREMGYNIKATIPLSTLHVVKIGTDYNNYRLNDWWPPVSASVGGMGNETFINVNNGQRDRVGIFAESDYQWSEKLSTQFGIRSDIVMMNTGNVKGYNSDANTTIANDPIDAAAFNALNHEKTDANFDLTALAKYENDQYSEFEIGYTRKTRSPNIYERYSWAGGYGSTFTGPISMDMAMINWFGDGAGYVGNINLKPEVAHTISATSTLHDAAKKEFEIKFTPYYTKVNDYIDVDYLGVGTGTGYADIQLLRFANHDAHLFGADLSGYASLWNNVDMGTGTIKSNIGITRGFRDDGGSLYHMMPFHANMSLDHTIGGLNSGIDIQAVAQKSAVDDTRREPLTPGYALVDLRTGYAFTKNIRLDGAITNLFDTAYALPLGGIDVVNYTKISYTPLQGMGRSYNVALNLKF